MNGISDNCPVESSVHVSIPTWAKSIGPTTITFGNPGYPPNARISIDPANSSTSNLHIYRYTGISVQNAEGGFTYIGIAL